MRVQTLAVTVRGSTVKQVQCKKCQCQYVYEMSRQKTRRSDPSMLAAGAAGGLIGVAIVAAVRAAAGGTSEDKLRSQAQKSLERELSSKCEPVPCPACGWYHPDMVKEARRRYRKGLLALGVSLLVIGTAGLVVLQSVNTAPYMKGSVNPIAFVIAGAVVLGGLGVLARRWSLQKAYDINAGYPAPRPPYPGSPQGFDVKDVAKATVANPGQAAAPALQPRPSAEVHWYYAQGERQTGPVTWGVLKSLAARGELGPRDFVFAMGTTDWVEAAQVPGLLPVA